MNIVDSPTSRGLIAVTFSITLSLVAVPAFAQRQIVVAEGAAVVVDGDYVRIDSGQRTATVSSDWRTTRVNVYDTETVLVELGAVKARDHIKVSLPEKMLFDFNSAAVTSDAATHLGQVAQVIRDEARGEVLVVGHTDSVGGDAANQRLSEARAGAVISWLHRKEGIPASMLVGRGVGEKQPVAHNTRPDGSDDPDGRARNRRVEIFVVTSENASARQIAGFVTIDGGNVDVGGIAQVDAKGNVQTQGVSISADGSVTTASGRTVGKGGASTKCAAGQTCAEDCPDGDCRLDCPAGAICNYQCRGGNCIMSCAAGAQCSFGCAGGNCQYKCALGANCKTTCSGGDCTGG